MHILAVDATMVTMVEAEASETTITPTTLDNTTTLLTQLKDTATGGIVIPVVLTPPTKAIYAHAGPPVILPIYLVT